MDKKGIPPNWYHKQNLYLGILIAVLILSSCSPKIKEEDVQESRAVLGDDLEDSPLEDKQLKDNSGGEEVSENMNQEKTEVMADQSNKDDDPQLIWDDKKQELVIPNWRETDIHVLIRQASAYPSGTVVDINDVKEEVWKNLFYSEELSEEVKKRITGRSYGDKCEVPFKDLRYIRVLYRGFDDLVHIGELIVNQSIALDVTEIFLELFQLDYPIEQMVLVDDYNADDNESMAHNNTSSFNYRNVDGTARLSLHSYGLAIDINPFYNPYVREINQKTVILPANGAEYADRSLDCRYYIKRGDPCYEAFIRRGFTWGGDWINSKDYQHFQKDTIE